MIELPKSLPSPKREYIILTSTDKERFEQNVEDHLKEGWELQGGGSYSSGYFSQAIVRVIYK